MLHLQRRGEYVGKKKGSEGKFARFADEHSESIAMSDDAESNTLSWSAARLKNALDRDFTVNGLMYDPFSRIVFDYINGIQDCRLNFLPPISYLSIKNQCRENCYVYLPQREDNADKLHKEDAAASKHPLSMPRPFLGITFIQVEAPPNMSLNARPYVKTTYTL